MQKYKGELIVNLYSQWSQGRQISPALKYGSQGSSRPGNNWLCPLTVTLQRLWGRNQWWSRLFMCRQVLRRMCGTIDWRPAPRGQPRGVPGPVQWLECLWMVHLLPTTRRAFELQTVWTGQRVDGWLPQKLHQGWGSSPQWSGRMPGRTSRHDLRQFQLLSWWMCIMCFRQVQRLCGNRVL